MDKTSQYRRGLKKSLSELQKEGEVKEFKFNVRGTKDEPQKNN